MSMLSHTQLVELVKTNVIEGALIENVNAASIDVRLGPVVWRESMRSPGDRRVHLARKETPLMEKMDISEQPYVLAPQKFCLAQTVEKFNLPNWLVATFFLKSSGARSGLDNALACFCDPGWHESVLTLELRNNLSYHSLVLEAGMKIGQMVFHQVALVAQDKSYAVRGQYNQDTESQPSKGLR